MVQANRLPTAFHEKFALQRNAVAEVLAVLSKVTDESVLVSKKMREKLIQENSLLGPNKVRSMTNYARGTGLLDERYQPTQLGRIVLTYDESLLREESMWLMHYHMSSPLGPGPEFWHQLVSMLFRTGNQFTKTDIRRMLEDSHFRSKGVPLGESSASSTPTVFVNSYVSSDGLAGLAILNQEGNSNTVLLPKPSSLWVFAYALIDYWQSEYSTRLGINLSEVTDEGKLSSIFLMDDRMVNDTLNELEREGIVQVFRTAPPHQLMLLTQNKEMILRKVYAVDAIL